MFDKMKQLMEMKKQADQIKRKLDVTDADVNEVSGVKITINGSQCFKSIEIDDSLITIENKKNLQDSILKSLNAAIKASQSLAASEMKGMLPGFPGL
ncbi:MAG: YbaB/EbfC family nucleoid-associated protein [Candidatus Zapsychrus exili]|nr:YbaB/EbfC family nucleoid-associated protein [Candidatus Zapsychrus exili]